MFFGYSLSHRAMEAKSINEKLGLVRTNGHIYFFNASGPIYGCAEKDKVGLRLAQGMFVELKLANPTELARALGVDQSTVHRNRKKYREGGVGSLKANKVKRSPSKLKKDKCVHAQKLLDRGHSLVSCAKEVGVCEGTIRYAIKKGRLRKAMSGSIAVKLKGPSERSIEDQISSNGIAVKRNTERSQARSGALHEASPVFSASEGVHNAGVLLALPMLLGQGLLSVGQKVYGSLKSGFFGLQSVLLTLSFMALLRIKSPEGLKDTSPGELGQILGLDRVPEVKTLRRKLKEMGSREKVREFSSSLTTHWAREKPESLGFLYVDGHVRPYNGRKHKLPKTHVARRRLCMDATTDFWVNDAEAEPLFFVTAKANDSLLSMLDNEILPEVKKVVGKDKRVTLIFDREGWSPHYFQKWEGDGFDVLTYRKGKYNPWPLECFSEVDVEVCGKRVKYKLAERSVEIKKKFWMREVRRLCDSGHQTSVMSTRQDLSKEELAYRMFSRWSQENFFRYMRHEYAIDHLSTYDVEKADPERLVPNPALKEQKKELEKLKREGDKLKEEYGDSALNNPESQRPTMRGFKIANSEQGKKIRKIENHCRQIEASIKALPKKVPLKELLKEEEIVMLERERKVLTDNIKMLSYRAETSLFNFIQPFFARHEDEGRSFLKSLFQTSADILPDEDNGRLVVRFHTMANQRSNKALKTLCEIVNQEKCLYPGTNLRLVYEFP